MFGYLALVVRTLLAKLRGGEIVWASGNSKQALVRMTMEVVISLVLLAVCLYVLIAGAVEKGSEKFFGSLLGTVVGYWLRPPDKI